MNVRSCRIVLTLLLILPGSFALADAQSGQSYITGMASYYDDDPDRRVEDGLSGGQLGIGRALNENWNLEGYASYFTPGGAVSQTHIDIGADLQLVFARESRLTPYLFIGASYLEVNPKFGSTENGAAISTGAGLLADIFGDSPVAVRVEYRYRSDNVLGTRLNDQIASLGLQIPFGGKRKSIETPPPVAVDPDSDNDGVTDSHDRCSGTPDGIVVDANGCPLDSDGDGVADHRDNCPGTMRGVEVDSNGCELDTDRDGVVDRIDKCPGTAAGVQVDVSGCEIKEEIKLPGVNFESNSDRLLPGATSVLQDAAETLRRNPSISVEVAGHTDSDGTAEYNQGLSSRRADTVRDYLISLGVSPARITARGYGELQPVVDNSTAAGKSQNRRVVLRVTAR